MTLPQKSSLEWIKLHSLRNVLFLFCSCWLQRQLVDFHWLQLKGWSWWIEHFTGRNSVFEVCRPKRCLFHLKSDYQSILTFGLLISHLQSLSVAGKADSQRSALQWTKACYVKDEQWAEIRSDEKVLNSSSVPAARPGLLPLQKVKFHPKTLSLPVI